MQARAESANSSVRIGIARGTIPRRIAPTVEKQIAIVEQTSTMYMNAITLSRAA
jgi:hypothetical protein